MKGMGQSSKDTNNEWAALGGLRFVLAWVVLTVHVQCFGPAPALTGFVELGSGAAVLLFFVISGYSIGHSYASHPDGFYGRRLDRIYPVYVFSLVLAAAVFIVYGPAVSAGNILVESPRTPLPLLAHFGFLQGILVRPIASNGALWSLSCEVIFYLLTPAFARLPSRVLAIAATLSWCAFLWAELAMHVVYQRAIWGGPAVLTAWAWLGGFLLARDRNNLWLRRCLLVGGLGAVGAIQDDAARLSPLLWAAGILLLCEAPSLKIPVRIAAAMSYLGELSYPLYAVHWPVLVMVLAAHGKAWGLAVAAAFTVALTTYHLIDQPYRVYAARRRQKNSAACLHPVPK